MPLPDVEKRLADARIPVYTKALPDGVNGMSYRLDGRMCVVVSSTLTRVERRCTLWHEYFHLKLFPGMPFTFHATYSAKLQDDKLEAAVHRATARQLVPTGKLRQRLKEGLTIAEIAEQFDVTVEVVEDAIEFQIRRRGRFV